MLVAATALISFVFSSAVFVSRSTVKYTTYDSSASRRRRSGAMVVVVVVVVVVGTSTVQSQHAVIFASLIPRAMLAADTAAVLLKVEFEPLKMSAKLVCVIGFTWYVYESTNVPSALYALIFDTTDGASLVPTSMLTVIEKSARMRRPPRVVVALEGAAVVALVAFVAAAVVVVVVVVVVKQGSVMFMAAVLTLSSAATDVFMTDSLNVSHVVSASASVNLTTVVGVVL